MERRAAWSPVRPCTASCVCFGHLPSCGDRGRPRSAHWTPLVTTLQAGRRCRLGLRVFPQIRSRFNLVNTPAMGCLGRSFLPTRMRSAGGRCLAQNVPTQSRLRLATCAPFSSPAAKFFKHSVHLLFKHKVQTEPWPGTTCRVHVSRAHGTLPSEQRGHHGAYYHDFGTRRRADIVAPIIWTAQK